MERGHATRYIVVEAGKPSGDPDFRPSAAHRNDYETYMMWADEVDTLDYDKIRELDRMFR